jgi:protein-S-isoprenylcysteine O-methyltransferase Ste14
MRLIWKEFDSEFDPIVTAVGVVFLSAGVFGVALLRHALRHPIVLVVAVIPLLMGAMGSIILVREYQLWKMRSPHG